MPHLNCNGINIFYEIHGTGTPLILISGLGGDRLFWQSSIEILSEKFQVITYDTRGIGKTDAPLGAYSMDIFASDLLALMNQLHIDKAHILGFSMGGNIALSFALKYPERLNKLILAATHAKMSAQIRMFVDAVLDCYENAINAKQMFDLICPWIFSNRFLEDPKHAAYLVYDENEPDQQPLHAWKNQYLAQRAYDVTDQIKDILLPTLILAADQDPFATVSDATFLKTQISQSDLKIFHGSGHLINYEYPELFHEYILDFLKE